MPSTVRLYVCRTGDVSATRLFPLPRFTLVVVLGFLTAKTFNFSSTDADLLVLMSKHMHETVSRSAPSA